MGEFRVHHVRFYEWTPKAIQCMSYNTTQKKLALSRGDGSIELWNIAEDWYQEEVIPGFEDKSIEDLVWQGDRLFSGGLDGNICEIDLIKLQTKTSCPSNAGPVWCLTSNSAKTRLAAGTEEGCVVLLDTEHNCLEYMGRFDSQESRILCVSWHPVEDLIVTGGIDNIRVWSVSSGRAMQRLTVARTDKNKETVIWCVAFLSDMTIVSGDSRGKTSFWNGRQGTVIKSIQSHKGDVYCLAVDDTESTVLASGVDSSVVQFNHIPARENSDWRNWVGSFVHNQHTHDVRAIQMIGHTVVSGGVDTNLIQFDLKAQGHDRGRKRTSSNRWKRIPPVLQKPLVRVAKDVNVLLLPYTHHLEVWRLGFTADKSGADGDILSLRSNPIKLISLKTKAGSPIFCCDITHDASLLAYSDCESTRVYQISLDDLTSIQPCVSMKKIESVADSTPDGAHCLCFTSDTTRLISVTNTSNLQISSVKQGKISVLHTFKQYNDYCHLLCVSPDDKLAAVADHKCIVNIYSLDKLQYVCKVPRQSHQVTAFSFSPDSTMIAMAYSNQKIFEFDVTSREFSDWSKRYSQRFMSAWLIRKSKISKLAYNPSHPDQIVVNDEQMFCILDKTQPFPENAKWSDLCSPKSEKSTAFHACNKYKYLLHLEVLPDNWLVAVERPPLEMFSSLPEALRKKKFGT